MQAIVITGPPGSGKTSTLTALADALSDDGVRHAAIEVESLVWTHPPLADEQWPRHLAASCALYREAGYELLLLAYTLETDHDVRRLLDVVAADEVFLVRLEAAAGLLAERIERREPAWWLGTPGLMAHARELATSMTRLSDVDLVLATDAARPEETVARIRAKVPSRWNASLTRHVG
jgi:adenylate kinase family enzyme